MPSKHVQPGDLYLDPATGEVLEWMFDAQGRPLGLKPVTGEKAMACKNCQCGKGGCSLPPDVQRDVDSGVLVRHDSPADTWAKTQMWGTSIGAGLVVAVFLLYLCSGAINALRPAVPDFEADGMGVGNFEAPAVESRP